MTVEVRHCALGYSYRGSTPQGEFETIQPLSEWICKKKGEHGILGWACTNGYSIDAGRMTANVGEWVTYFLRSHWGQETEMVEVLSKHRLIYATVICEAPGGILITFCAEEKDKPEEYPEKVHFAAQWYKGGARPYSHWSTDHEGGRLILDLRPSTSNGKP